jgi:hypothetical protein
LTAISIEQGWSRPRKLFCLASGPAGHPAGHCLRRNPEDVQCVVQERNLRFIVFCWLIRR